MRQEDMDKISRRLASIVKDMVDPNCDHKIVLVIAVHDGEHIELNCTMNTHEHEIGAWICDQAAEVFQKSADLRRQEIGGRVLDVLMKAARSGSLKEALKEALAEDESAGQTKH